MPFLPEKCTKFMDFSYCSWLNSYEKQLKDIVSKGVHPARQITRARILLLLNERKDREGNAGAVPGQREIAERCRCNTVLVYTVSKQYVKEGLERVLNRKNRESPPVPAKVTGEVEAKIIALSCSEPPAGYGRWTLRLLAERSREAVGIELAYTTIGLVLKKNTPKTPSKGVLVHTAEGKRGVCGQDGGCS
jgi:transposase